MADSERFEYGALTVDLESRQAWLHGEELGLTSTEFLLLKAFVTNPGKVFTRDELLDKVWGNEFDGSPRAIDAHIKNLRKKLSAVILSVEFIQSIRGMGYKFVPPPAGAAAVPVAPAAEKKPEMPLSNLPVALTSFIGRARERAEIGEAMEQARLLTLTGPGGSGKTRLAVETARAIVSKHADGVWLVELAALTDPNLVPSAVAAALKLREEASRALTETLLEHLREKKLLLVLDNCEHLIDACARLIETLLEGCPGLRVLATSREALKIPGERTYNVPPMAAPSGTPALPELLELDAVILLIDRVRSISPAFKATKDNAHAIAQICSQLDGMPLAIELAAGRARVMPVEQIAARLTHRLALLSGGSRTALPRHQTLQAAIRWSYELLTDEEAALFARLAVFRGGFTLEAVEQICPGGDVKEEQVIDLLARLVEKSLVTMVEGEGERARYDMLVTIREFAEEKLEALEGFHAVRQRHAGYFVSLAEAGEQYLDGVSAREWLSRFDAELENFRNVFQWCLDGKPGSADLSLRLGGSLRSYWMTRGYSGEGRKLLERAISMGAGEDPPLAKALFSAGEMAWEQADYPAAESLIERALALYERFDYKKGIAIAHQALGNIAGDRSDYVDSTAHYEKSLATYRRIGNRTGIANVLNCLGVNAHELGDYGREWALYEEGLQHAEAAGAKMAHARILTNVSNLAIETLEFEKAKPYATRALEAHRELKDRKWEGLTLRNLAIALAELGETEKAGELFREALGLFEAIGDALNGVNTLIDQGFLFLKRENIFSAANLAARCADSCRRIEAKTPLSKALELAACAACARSSFERAARLFGATGALRKELGYKSTPLDEKRAAPYAALARNSLGDAAFERFFQEGAGAPLDALVEEALTDLPDLPRTQP